METRRVHAQNRTFGAIPIRVGRALGMSRLLPELIREALDAAACLLGEDRRRSEEEIREKVALMAVFGFGRGRLFAHKPDLGFARPFLGKRLAMMHFRHPTMKCGPIGCVQVTELPF